VNDAFGHCVIGIHLSASVSQMFTN